MNFHFYSIVHHLKNEIGHFYHYHLGMQEIMESLGCLFQAHIKKDAFLNVLPNHWHKTFHSIHNRENRRRFFKDCLALFRKNKKEHRIFFIEFFNRKDFVLIALAALLTCPRKKNSFWILFRDDLTTRRKKDAVMLRFFSKLLEKKFNKNFIPLTDSESLSDYYQHWFSQKVVVLPIMHTQYQKIIPLSKRKKRLTLSWLGAPRTEKGLKEIQMLVQLQDPFSQRFSLEIAGSTPFPKVTNELNIVLQKVQLSQEEYFTNLQEADAILLPYEPYKYKWRTSGIFVEAIAAGKLPIVRGGTWLATELQQHDLHELIVDWNHPHFFTHLYELMHSNVIHQKFKKMQEHYAAYHCKEHFRKEIKMLLPQDK